MDSGVHRIIKHPDLRVFWYVLSQLVHVKPCCCVHVGRVRYLVALHTLQIPRVLAPSSPCIFFNLAAHAARHTFYAGKEKVEWPLWWEQFPAELSEAAPQLPEGDIAALTQELSTEEARRVFQVRVVEALGLGRNGTMCCRR